MLRFLPLALLGIPACIPSGRYPASVHVAAYGSPHPRTAFVLVYDPYPADRTAIPAMATPPTDTLLPLKDVTVSCTNVRCKAFATSVELEKPAPGVDHVEVKIEKSGYEPTTITIPFGPDVPQYPHYAILLSRAAGAN